MLTLPKMDLLEDKMKEQKKRQGFSLAEILVAAGLSLIILFAVAVLYLSSQKSFKFGQDALGTEANLRLAMDWITKDIREATGINSTGNTYTLTMPSSIAPGDVVYTWDENNNQLERDDATSSRIIATGVTQFEIVPDGSSDLVAVTLSARKGDLKKDYQLTCKARMRNAK